MYRITRFETDGVVFDIPQAAGNQDAGGPGVVANILQLPSGGAFDGSGVSQTQVRFPAQIGVSGDIIGTSATAVRFEFEDMQRAIGKRGQLYRCDENGDYQYTTARLTGVSATRTPRSVLVLPVQLQFTQLTPWYSVNPSGAWHIGDDSRIGDAGLRVGCYAPVEMFASPIVLRLQNLGTAPARSVRLWFLPGQSEHSVGDSAVEDLTFSVADAIDWTWAGSIEGVGTYGELAIDVGANAITQTISTIGPGSGAYTTIDAYDVTFGDGHTIAELVRVEDYSLLDLSIAWGNGVNYPKLIVTAEVLDTWV